MPEADETIVIYTTFANEQDARKLGQELVGERLAACVNIFPAMTSIYRWEGDVQEGSEVVMIVKSRSGLKDALLAAIASRHPYTVPALLAFSPAQVASSYWAWLQRETTSQGKTDL